MRITSDARDYRKKYTVLLDGVDVTNLCYEANDKRGYVKGFMHDQNGQMLINADKTDILKFKSYGKVKIIVEEI